MNRLIDRLKLVFLGIFVVAAAAVWIYQIHWVQPKLECEEKGAWWAPDWRACRKPVSVAPYDGPPPPPLDSLKPTLPPPAAPAGKG